MYTFASLFMNGLYSVSQGTLFTTHYSLFTELERWVSGLNQQFAKLSYGKLYRGFESPLLREDCVGLGVSVMEVCAWGVGKE